MWRPLKNLLCFFVALLWVIFLCPNFSSADPNKMIDIEDQRQWPHSLWLQMISAQKPEWRARTAVALGRMQRPDVVPHLLKLTQDPVPTVRIEAIFALGQLAWESPWTHPHTHTIIQRLQQILNTSTVREEQLVTIEALGKYAPVDLPAWLRPLWQGNDAILQAEAWLALFRYRLAQKQRLAQKSKASAKSAQTTASTQPVKKQSATAKQSATSQHTQTSPSTTQPATKPSMHAASSTESSLPTWVFVQMRKHSTHLSPNVRRNIAYYFARTQDPEGWPILEPLAQDSDIWVRYFALFALQRLKVKQATTLGLSALKHPSYFLRVAGIQLLEAIQQTEQLPTDLRKDPSFHVRAAWAQAMGTARRVDTYVLQKLAHTDPSVTVRTAALLSLVRHRKDETSPILFEWLKHSDPLLREAVVQTSPFLGHQKMQVLYRASLDSSPMVRASALEHLAKTNTPRAFDIIKQALHSPHLAERGHAVYALRQHKHPHVSDLAWDTYQRSLAAKWIELREDLVDLIAKPNSPTTTSRLQKLLQDPAPSVVRKAQVLLKKRGILVSIPMTTPRLPFSPYRHFRFHHNPIVVLITNRGVIEIECYAQDAPIHVANFVGLARRGFYDGLTWHRVVSNFVIQGGDPDGSGWGDGGFQLRSEINRKRFQRGTLGMPRSQGWDTGSVQIFITLTPTPHLDGKYTVFGRVIRGLQVVDRIERGDRILRTDIKMNLPQKR